MVSEVLELGYREDKFPFENHETIWESCSKFFKSTKSYGYCQDINMVK
jgi:hypothetical protein